jgi:hypothetical protein
MSYQVGKDGEHFQTETLYSIKYPNGEWYQKTSESNVFREDECHATVFFKSKLDAVKAINLLVADARNLGVADYAPELHKFERRKVWTKPTYLGTQFDKYGDVKP